MSSHSQTNFRDDDERRNRKTAFGTTSKHCPGIIWRTDRTRVIQCIRKCFCLHAFQYSVNVPKLSNSNYHLSDTELFWDKNPGWASGPSLGGLQRRASLLFTAPRFLNNPIRIENHIHPLTKNLSCEQPELDLRRTIRSWIDFERVIHRTWSVSGNAFDCIPSDIPVMFIKCSVQINMSQMSSYSGMRIHNVDENVQVSSSCNYFGSHSPPDPSVFCEQFRWLLIKLERYERMDFPIDLMSIGWPIIINGCLDISSD
jgi:hypothetical protein